ncbi:MAG TPA: MlaD family protein [Gemmatimonadaceae bacterium]|nr:MlaD family protein [Gemmatimonadaceae bacterium]
MPAHRLTWRRLVPGLLALAALIVGAGSILAFARVGALRGDSYTFQVLAGNAGGVLKGTEVWVSGHKVGVVRGVDFRPPSSDTLARLAVRVQVLRRYQEIIRHDSRVTFHSGGTPIGASIVAIEGGSPRSPMLGDEDTIRATPWVDTDSLRTELELVARQLPLVLRDARAAGAGIERALGRLDTATSDGRPAVRMLTGDVRRFASPRGTGTLPRLLHDRALRARARSAMADARSLLAPDTEAEGTLARLRSDSLLLRRLASVREELASIRASLAEEHGTAGRLASDAALERELGALQENIDSTIADVKRHPGRYVGF